LKLSNKDIILAMGDLARLSKETEKHFKKMELLFEIGLRDIFPVPSKVLSSLSSFLKDNKDIKSSKEKHSLKNKTPIRLYIEKGNSEYILYTEPLGITPEEYDNIQPFTSTVWEFDSENYSAFFCFKSCADVIEFYLHNETLINLQL